MTVSRAAIDNHRNVSTVVVEAVAESMGVSPLELDPPLHRVVDPDALDDLFGPTGAATEPTRVSFTYAGHEVTVQGRGDVEVRPASESEPVA
ncbi:HalOD1 output domain-containing protein [Halorussus halobius]|uniref:HalOD1 output domain-containing protein n=1 Tax=Halorussus halobius TaxID=1710537 RepID=UPI001092260D|nr:HalOD1 output domain-containing protein [Halorussus halobius]